MQQRPPPASHPHPSAPPAHLRLLLRLPPTADLLLSVKLPRRRPCCQTSLKRQKSRRNYQPRDLSSVRSISWSTARQNTLQYRPRRRSGQVRSLPIDRSGLTGKCCLEAVTFGLLCSLWRHQLQDSTPFHLCIHICRIMRQRHGEDLPLTPVQWSDNPSLAYLRL